MYQWFVGVRPVDSIELVAFENLFVRYLFSLFPALVSCEHLQSRICLYFSILFWYVSLFFNTFHYFSVMRHWQLIRSKLGLYFSSGITLDIDDFFLWRTSYWSIEDKTYKKVERNPFSTFSRKSSRKSKHVCLYTSETHWQFTGILPIYNGRHAKSHNSKL